MHNLTSLRTLTVEQGEEHTRRGAVYVDVREVSDYLDEHVPGSLSLEYEFGPGMPGRARDCVPLDTAFVLLERPGLDMHEVAASFRGKGFAVEGVIVGGARAWTEERGGPASTEVYEGRSTPEGTLLDIGDPGTRILEGARFISIERLWEQAASIATSGEKVVIAAGRGLRSALAVGMLERAGAEEIVFWWTRGRQTTTVPRSGVVKR